MLSIYSVGDDARDVAGIVIGTTMSMYPAQVMFETTPQSSLPFGNRRCDIQIARSVGVSLDRTVRVVSEPRRMFGGIGTCFEPVHTDRSRTRPQRL